MHFSGRPIYRYVSVSADISVIGQYIGFADIANAYRYRLLVLADKKAYIGGLTDKESRPKYTFFYLYNVEKFKFLILKITTFNLYFDIKNV